MPPKTDQFLSEEDLDLRDLSDEQLIFHWNLWLKQAQITNDLDELEYSHGVFMEPPRVQRNSRERARETQREYQG
jgi:hypothetical protein